MLDNLKDNVQWMFFPLKVNEILLCLHFPDNHGLCKHMAILSTQTYLSLLFPPKRLKNYLLFAHFPAIITNLFCLNEFPDVPSDQCSCFWFTSADELLPLSRRYTNVVCRVIYHGGNSVIACAVAVSYRILRFTSKTGSRSVIMIDCTIVKENEWLSRFPLFFPLLCKSKLK